MVEVVFKFSDVDKVLIDLTRAEPLHIVLSKSAALAGVELAGYIAVRGGKVISGKDLVQEDDVIEVYPAISGG